MPADTAATSVPTSQPSRCGDSARWPAAVTASRGLAVYVAVSSDWSLDEGTAADKEDSEHKAHFHAAAKGDNKDSLCNGR